MVSSKSWNIYSRIAPQRFATVMNFLANMMSAMQIFLSDQGQPIGKDPHAYLPFRYNGYRYPRLARNFWENRKEIHEQRPSDPSWTSGNVTAAYRAFRPRYLCYLEEKVARDRNGEEVMMRYFKTKPVRKVS